MKNPADPSPVNADLPSFFDAGDGTETQLEHGTATESESEALTDGDETLDTPGNDAETSEHTGDAPHATTLLHPTARTVDPARPAGGSAFATVLGGVATTAAAVLATVLEGSNATAALTRFGVTPGTLLVLGGVAFGVAAVRRHLGTLHARLAARGSDDHAARASQAMQESLEFLVAAQHASNERPPAAGEELQHVLMAMQRQDEKINNLTKAIKMYGKPLMEISGQTTELAGAIAQTRSAVEASTEATRQTVAGLEAQLRKGSSSKELAEILDGVHVIAADVDKLCKSAGNQPSLEPLQQKLARVEVAVAAVAQRLENSEMQKSLLRLEDAAQKTREEVHQLRGDGLGKATTHLQDRLEKATKGLADGLQQMRDGNLGGLESGVREIQRELSGVATAVAQIQAVVRSGKGAVAAAPAPMASAPTPAAAAPAPAPAPAPTAGAAPAAADGGNTGYSTGARSSSGKNVLGAIAKLKQMKN